MWFLRPTILALVVGELLLVLVCALSFTRLDTQPTSREGFWVTGPRVVGQNIIDGNDACDVDDLKDDDTEDGCRMSGGLVYRAVIGWQMLIVGLAIFFPLRWIVERVVRDPLRGDDAQPV